MKIILNSEIAKIQRQHLKSSSPDHSANFNQTWHKTSLDEGLIQVLTNEGSYIALKFAQGEIIAKIVKMH